MNVEFFHGRAHSSVVFLYYCMIICSKGTAYYLFLLF